ncbi:MAG: hypothetical protein ACOYEO_02845 [bacterium]
MATTAYTKVFPPEVRQHFDHFHIPKKLLYKLIAPEPVRTPTGAARRPSRPPTGGG